jgi:hypothetical protein
MLPPEDELCLLLARTHLSSEGRERALSLLAGPLEWPRLFERARTYEIFPLVFAGLRTLGFPNVRDSVRLEWTKVFKSNAIRNELLARESARIMRLLGDAGIPVMPLKGIALAESLYGDTALRACADIDVLVPPRNAIEAFHVVVSSGYRPEFTEPRLLGLLARYARDFMMMTRQDSTGTYTCELHCALIWGSSLERELLDEIWTSAGRNTFYGCPTRSLSSEWELVYLAVHAARHGGPSLKWLADLDRLCCGGAIDWKKASKNAKWVGWEAVVRSSLAVCASLFETPVDPAFGSTALAHRPVTPRAVEVPSASEILFSLRLLKTPGRRLRYLAAHLFMPTQADCRLLPLPSSLFFVYYALRPFRVACNTAWWFAQAGLRALERTLRNLWD